MVEELGTLALYLRELQLREKFGGIVDFKNQKNIILVNKIEFYRIELNRFANLLILKSWLRGEDLNL